MKRSTMMSTKEPLHIVVVGAGIGGLTAAIALRQQGHHVTILEQSRMAQETGAAIHLAPNSNGLLRRLGLHAEEFGAVECLGFRNYAPSGHMRMSTHTGHAAEKWKHPWHLVHRGQLHAALKDKAIADGSKLALSSRVESVDAEAATVVLEDGQRVQGDLVIGADGVHSMSRKSVTGGETLVPFDSGKSAFRFLLPTDMLRADPVTAASVEKYGYLTMWIGADRRLVMYPCNNNTMMNVVAIHPSEESASEVTGHGGWQEWGSKERLLQIYQTFASPVPEILAKADSDKLKVWKLLDMDKSPTFITGKLAVIGDAAHPFLPHQGQGGGQAIEDAVSLATVLPPGTAPEDIPSRLAMYEECRYERAHKIQEFTRLAGMDTAELAKLGKTLDMNEYVKYNFGHDEYEASAKVLDRHLNALGAPEERSAKATLTPNGPRSAISVA